MIPRSPKHDAPLDPAIEAELAALEAALADAPSADPELAALVREVRAQAPSMPLALRERLDADLAAGFPRARRGLPWPTLTVGRVLPVLGGLAAVLVALVVATGTLSGGGTGGGGSAPSGLPSSAVTSGAAAGSAGGTVTEDGGAAKPAAPDASSGPAAGAEAAPASGADSSASATGKVRKVERAVDLSLTVGPGKLQDAADGVVRATQSVGGYVSDSQISARGALGDGAFTLRVPTARLDEAVAKLSKLGHVASLNQSAQDITGSFVSVGDQLSDARRERAALVRALGHAQTEGEIAALKERIAQNRAELATLKGRLDALRRRADLSTVAVTLTARRGVAAGAGASDSRWGVGDAARDALHVLQVVAGVIIVAAAVLVPLALLGLLGGLLARSQRRRRREHALDTASP